MDRRKFLYGMGLTGGLALAGKGVADLIDPSNRAYASTKLDVASRALSADRELTPEKDVTTYNNFYDLGPKKDQPAKNAQNFRPLRGSSPSRAKSRGSELLPWTISSRLAS